MSAVSDLVKVSVGLEGVPPGILFQGKGLMIEEAKNPKSSKKGAKNPRTLEEEAELRAHWKGAGKKRELCIPSVMLYNAICSAAGDFKNEKNKKQTMGVIIASAISFEEDKIGLGNCDYEVYEDFCRIPPRTGAMVLIGRPLIPEWNVEFTMSVNDEMFSVSLLMDIIQHAGKVVGIGAWRPKLKGPYGKFQVTKFDAV